MTEPMLTETQEMEQVAQKVTEMTASELLIEVRKPGRVYMAALMSEDVWYVQAVKADLIWHLEQAIEEGVDATFSANRHDDGFYIS